MVHGTLISNQHEYRGNRRTMYVPFEKLISLFWYMTGSPIYTMNKGIMSSVPRTTFKKK